MENLAVAKRIPRINEWYQDVRDDIVFKVVAVDKNDQTIEIQYYDGEVGEIDFESWREMVLLPATAPDDWRGSYEMGDDDGEDDDVAGDSDRWADPLARVEPDDTFDIDDFDDH